MSAAIHAKPEDMSRGQLEAAVKLLRADRDKLLKAVDEVLAYDSTYPDVLTGDVPPRLHGVFVRLRGARGLLREVP